MTENMSSRIHTHAFYEEKKKREGSAGSESPGGHNTVIQMHNKMLHIEEAIKQT